jgi:hypothetical protein
VTGQTKPNYRLARPLFIWEANASLTHTHHTSSVVMKKCASLGGTTIATKCDIKEASWFVSWYFLVKCYAFLPSEGIEEDILFGLWSIYIEEFCWVFFPMRVSQDNMCVYIVYVIASLLVILFMQLMC